MSPWGSTSIRAVFLDAVGTLIHPEPPAPAVYTAMARRYGSRLDLPEIAARFSTAFRRQEELDHAAGQCTSEERETARWREIVGEVINDIEDINNCFNALYDHFAEPGAWRCAPGTREVLAALVGRGYGLGIASNFDCRLRGVAAGLSELRPVGHLVISSEVGWRKPAPAFFAAVCAAAGCRPDEVLFVGDDFTNDYAGTRAAGLRALLLDPHGRAPLPPAERLSHIRDLLSLL